MTSETTDRESTSFDLDAPLPEKGRRQLIRDMAVFQVKLFADGFKDVLLSPVSLIAGIMGIFLGGRTPGTFFYSVLRLGKQTENWIGLFNAAYPQDSDQASPGPQSSSPTEAAVTNRPDERELADFDALVDRLQSSLLDPEARAHLSQQSKKQIEAIAKRLRRDGV